MDFISPKGVKAKILYWLYRKFNNIVLKLYGAYWKELKKQ